MDTTTLKPKLEEVMSFFNNPLSTPIGQKIEHSTDPTQASDNWQMLMEICDMLNMHSDEQTVKDFVRAVKKRLNSKNNTIIMYTLTLIETSVKNCANCEKFRGLVLSKDFVEALIRVISPKNDPPQQIQDKILYLIQSWADTFKTSELVTIYEDLKDKGIEFPMTDLDSMAPILTPKQNEYAEEPILHPVSFNRPTAAPQPTPEQLTKLRRELSIVQTNMTVFNEILSERELNQEDEDFLENLYTTTKEMQRRIANLLVVLSTDDELVNSMLHINDELNNVFLRYKRHRNNIEKTSNAKELIDFGVSTKSSGAIPKVAKNQDDFEAFAVSRSKDRNIQPQPLQPQLQPQQISPLSASSLVTVADEDFDEIIKTHSESDFNEMEQWLKTYNPPPSQEPPTTTLSSSEFDKFLEERAAASKNK